MKFNENDEGRQKDEGQDHIAVPSGTRKRLALQLSSYWRHGWRSARGGGYRQGQSVVCGSEGGGMEIILTARCGLCNFLLLGRAVFWHPNGAGKGNHSGEESALATGFQPRAGNFSLLAKMAANRLRLN